MVNNNLYTQYDDTLYFTFDGIYSKLYNTFITREDRDDFIVISEISNNIDFTTPAYANSTYLNSNNISQYTIKFHIAAYDVDNSTLDHIRSWLRLGKTGTLFFDTNKFWGYDAIISNITEENKMHMNNGNYIVTYAIELKTVGLAAYTSVTNPSVSEWQDKTGTRTFLDETICNDLSIPEIDFKDNTIIVPHVTNGGYYIHFTYHVDNSMNIVGLRLIVNNNSVPQFQYSFIDNPTTGDVVYDSKIGLLIKNGRLLDTQITTPKDTKNYNHGILLQRSYAPVRMASNNIQNPIKQNTPIKVVLTDKEYYQLLLHEYTNAFISIGHLVDLEPLYGVHPYGKNTTFPSDFYPYRYSSEGCLWYCSDLCQLSYNMQQNRYEGKFQNNHNCNDRIIADNVCTLDYYMGNYDTYQIQIKKPTISSEDRVRIQQTTSKNITDTIDILQKNYSNDQQIQHILKNIDEYSSFEDKQIQLLSILAVGIWQSIDITKLTFGIEKYKQ